jgi:hypothetical protein
MSDTKLVEVHKSHITANSVSVIKSSIVSAKPPSALLKLKADVTFVAAIRTCQEERLPEDSTLSEAAGETLNG